MPEDNKWKSLNLETGMVEDIEDMRVLVIKLAQMLEDVLTHPLIELIMPEGIRMDYAILTVGAKSMAQFISEADFMRLTAVLSGQGREAGELVVLMGGLSETLPSTHPSLKKRNIPADELAAMEPMGSMILDKVLKQEQDKLTRAGQIPLADAKAEAINDARTTPEPERVMLMPNIDDFLKSLVDKDKPPEGA